MFSLRPLPGVVLVTAGTLAGCKSDHPSIDTQVASATTADSSSAAPAVVTVTANDFSFEAPGRVSAGVVTMRLVNNGKELHHAQMIRIEEGKTMDDIAKALKNPGPPPSWVKWVGGPNAVLPGKETHSTSVLTPGLYAYLCFIPSPDRVIHASKGMILPFEVTPATTASASDLPAPDVTIKLVDYDFKLSAPLTPGKRTILVENDGPQPHEIALLKLAPGKTVADFAAWDEGGMKGPPPAEPIGGVVALDKGARATFTVDLTAGNYGLLCFVPDTKDGRPHLAHGMIKTIKVG
jgi:plastocyanin